MSVRTASKAAGDCSSCCIRAHLSSVLPSRSGFSHQGPTKPELRIGNLVVPGKLVKLPKPLLVLVSHKLHDDNDAAADSAQQGQAAESSQASGKRKAGDASEVSPAKKPRTSDDDNSSSSSSSTSSAAAAASSDDGDCFPRSCLRTVAIIRQKYVFTQRPYAICENATNSAATNTTKTEKASKAH